MTDDQLDKAIAEVWTMFKETDRRFQETDRKLKEIGKMVGNLTHKWGRFIENIGMVQKVLFNGSNSK